MKLRRKNTFLPIALFLIIAGCADARLVEGPEVEQADVEGSEENADHLHEDGNWYAGWAVTVSEELTDVTTVEDDLLIIPRDEIFDLELSILSPMDIIVGASENNGFLKRVLKVDADENQWEITVEDAQLQDVFLEGQFRLDASSSEVQGGQTRRMQLEDEGTSPGHFLETRRSRLEPGEVKEQPQDVSCGANCTMVSEKKIGGGVTAKFSPQVELRPVERTGKPVSVRTLFEFESELPERKEAARGMCESLSAAAGKMNTAHRELVNAVRDRSATDDAIENHVEARVGLYEWALKYAGHSPFPPFALRRCFGSESDGDWACIQMEEDVDQRGQVGGCESTQVPWFSPGVKLGTRTGLCGPQQNENRFFVRRLGDSEYELGEVDSDHVYHAMTPEFRLATFDMSREQALRPNDSMANLFDFRWPSHLALLPSPNIVNKNQLVEHKGARWLRSAIELRELPGGDSFTFPLASVEANRRVPEFVRSTRRLEDSLRPNFVSRGKTFFGVADNRQLWSDLNDRPATGNLKWFASSVAVGKLFCQGVDVNNARMAVGGTLGFTHAPKLTLTFEQSGSIKGEAQLDLFEKGQLLTVGPVPVHIALKGSLGFTLSGKVTGEVELEVRRHLANIDFLLGLRKYGGKWGVMTLGNETEFDQPEESENTVDPYARGNTFQLLQSPTSQSTEDYRNDTDLLSVNGSVSGQLGVETGADIEFILYKTFGIGGSVRLSKDLTAEYGTQSGAKIDVLIGPSASVFTSLKLPLCSKRDSCDSLEEAVNSMCQWPLYSSTPLCSKDICGDKPWLCPTLNPGGEEVKLRLPVYNTCAWGPKTPAEPLCTPQKPFNMNLEPLPPCARICYRSSPKSGNRWIALSNLESSPDNHAWAEPFEDETRGFSIDSIRITRDDGVVLRPDRVRVDGDSLDGREIRRLERCEHANCTSDVTMCSAEQVRERLIHFKNSLEVRFDKELESGDVLHIDELRIQRGTTSPPELEVCGFDSEYEVYVGTRADQGYWKLLGETASASTLHSFPITAADFATSTNGKSTDEITKGGGQ